MFYKATRSLLLQSSSHAFGRRCISIKAHASPMFLTFLVYAPMAGSLSRFITALNTSHLSSPSLPFLASAPITQRAALLLPSTSFAIRPHAPLHHVTSAARHFLLRCQEWQSRYKGVDAEQHAPSNDGGPTLGRQPSPPLNGSGYFDVSSPSFPF